MDHNRTPIYSALEEYAKADILSFDVPGHKKKLSLVPSNSFWDEIVKYDANSTKDLDLLSNPTGVIAEAEALLADAYNSDYAFLLVNGSTFGILAMILSACNPNDKILVPRNVHKSVINGIILSGANPIFIEPELDYEYGIANGVSYAKIKKALESHPDIKALFLINPTYFGATSDIKSIIELCHRKQVLVLADEAHGAHFPFSDKLPESAMVFGADMSTASMHKTCGSLTQSSILLLNEGNICKSKVRDILNLIQTTSSSYLLMSSIDLARKKLVLEGQKIFDDLLEIIKEAQMEIKKIPGLSILTKDYINGQGVFAFDETKMVIKVNELGLTGFEVYDLLKDEYNIQVELAETYVILAIVSVGDGRETIMRLVAALKDLSKRFYGKKEEFIVSMASFFEKPGTVVSPRDAFYSPKKQVLLDKSEGEICGESIMIYPPGIPLIIPGEKINKSVIEHYKFYKEQGCIMVNNDDDSDYITVLGE